MRGDLVQVEQNSLAHLIAMPPIQAQHRVTGVRYSTDVNRYVIELRPTSPVGRITSDRKPGRGSRL